MKHLSLLLSSTLILGALPAQGALIGYWNFESDFNDQSGNGNNATALGTAGAVSVNTTNPAAVGTGSAVFDNGATGGGLNILSVNNGAGGLQVTQFAAFTISMWFNSSVVQPDRRIFSEGSTTSNNPLYNIGTGNAAATAGAVDFYRRLPTGAVTNNHDKSTETPFGTSTWHNIVWVDTSGAVDLYIDGAFSRSFTYTDTDLAVNTTTFGGILRGAACCGFTGSLDDIGIWNEAPTNPAAFASAIASGAAANTVSITIPEPGTAFLGFLALGGLALRRRR